MCDLVRTIPESEVTGYKVVAKKNGKYYSFAIGFQYKQPIHRFKGRRVKQNTLVDWNSVLYNYNYYYNEDLIGRTAAFKSKKHATLLADKIIKRNLRGYPKDIEIVVVKVKLSGRLMEGTMYMRMGDCSINNNFFDAPVWAGSTLEIIG